MPRHPLFLLIKLSVCVNLLTASLCYAQTTPHKIPFTPLGQLSLTTDTEWLDKYYRDKITDSIQIVGLGEVSHGSYEPMAFKAKMMQYLVEKKGYRLILFEKSDFYLRNIAAYLQDNKVQDDTIVQWLKTNFSWSRAAMRSLNELLSWIKRYNLAHPKDMVSVGGYDMGREPQLVSFVVNNYITPLNYAEGDRYAYKLSGASDTTRLKIIRDWFNKNRHLLINRSGQEITDRLDRRIAAVEYEIERIKLEMRYGPGNIEKLYRDSIMYLNVLRAVGKKKAILSSHNAHMIRSGQHLMGDHLGKLYGPSYYVILTDFSGTADVEFIRSKPGNASLSAMASKTLRAYPNTAAADIAKTFGVNTGMFLHQDILKYRILDRTNAIDNSGIHTQFPAHPRAFDAVAIFDSITIDGKPKL